MILPSLPWSSAPSRSSSLQEERRSQSISKNVELLSCPLHALPHLEQERSSPNVTLKMLLLSMMQEKTFNNSTKSLNQSTSSTAQPTLTHATTLRLRMSNSTVVRRSILRFRCSKTWTQTWQLPGLMILFPAKFTWTQSYSRVPASVCRSLSKLRTFLTPDIYSISWCPSHPSCLVSRRTPRCSRDSCPTSTWDGPHGSVALIAGPRTRRTLPPPITCTNLALQPKTTTFLSTNTLRRSTPTRSSTKSTLNTLNT